MIFWTHQNWISGEPQEFQDGEPKHGLFDAIDFSIFYAKVTMDIYKLMLTLNNSGVDASNGVASVAS